MPIFFLLLVLVPVLGEESALPQPLFLPRPWQSLEQGWVGHSWGLAGAEHWGPAKAGQFVGMDAEVWCGKGLRWGGREQAEEQR